MTNERDGDIAGGVIYQINKERVGHFMGDCAGDKCPDWITRQVEIVKSAFATVRAEERKAAMRDAILLVDTAPLCHCASKQYIDPVALVQRMNAALEDAAENRKKEG